MTGAAAVAAALHRAYLLGWVSATATLLLLPMPLEGAHRDRAFGPSIESPPCGRMARATCAQVDKSPMSRGALLGSILQETLQPDLAQVVRTEVRYIVNSQQSRNDHCTRCQLALTV